MCHNTGQVWLVGAGCGGPELLTLRAISLLAQCDAVVYDDLIAPAILTLAPAEAQLIYMGKRSGRHSAPQEEICETLIRLAREGKRVVRLKGGDPYVFGRGGEEMLTLLQAGIACEEVPGISSAIAIPAAAGIPVTHRQVSRSVHIITGHTADTPDGLPAGLDALAKTEGTLVFLMGLGHLEAIAARLIQAGMSPDTPAAVLSGGNSPNPATVRAPLSRIANAARRAGVAAPAVIVVGEVARMEFAAPRPLDGVQVGLVGTDAITGKLRELLVPLGVSPRLLLRSIVAPLPVDLDWDRLTDGGSHWIVLTSVNGVELFFRRLAEEKLDLRRLHRCKFAVIGAATGHALESHGIRADLCPDHHTSAALGQALCRAVLPGEDVFIFRSAQGSPELTAPLAEANIPTKDIPLYRPQTDTRIPPGDLSNLRYLVFASAGGAEQFRAMYGPIPEHVTCVAIGNVTARALKRTTLLAGDISAQGIVDTLLHHYQNFTT